MHGAQFVADDGNAPVLPAAARGDARELVFHLAAVKWSIGTLRAVVELGIPDLLADGPGTAGELAALAGVDASRLRRVLSAAATAGVLVEDGAGRFSLTPAADGLRTGGPGGFRDVFLFLTDPMMWRPYEDVAHAVRTGEPAFDHLFGEPFYEHLRRDPVASDLFDRAMVQNDGPETYDLFDDLDARRYRRIADVGGGRGSFLAGLLRRHPGVTGAVCDHPLAIAGAADEFARCGVADRAEAIETDFFEKVPPGFDAYLVKRSLQNWEDLDAVRVLARVREAIGDDRDARLWIVNHLLTRSGVPDLGKLSDIEMMAILGGRERGWADWTRLGAEAGFAPVGEPGAGRVTLLTFRPI
ncbi:O-methyltransferase [Saccharothrix carnea]|uniref:O-methyltransferase n=1 Tax=Saccharothrix carnea TaxID=1280637 RepID=A0A2P8HIH5_SACCR|nr:methyltransferase [Saccharothrix carnea]PSL46023.1 O-methyltransferase [Saccharothrix carnea]